MPGEHPPTDAELIAQVRAGDRRAYGPLYERHRAAALRVARHFTRDEASAEDLTAEAFTRVLAAIDRGNGPDEAFRPYLYTTLRRTAFDWGESSRRVRLVEDISELEVTAAAVAGEDLDPVEVAFDRQLAAQAFHSLPERWQIVLWHLEVEGESPGEVGPLLDLSASAVSALAYRARGGLRQAFLQAHLAETVSPTCRPHASRLAAFVRGRLGSRGSAQVERHLDTCADCTGLYLELLRFNEPLGDFVAPLVFGSAAAVKIGAAIALGTAAAATGVAVTSTGAVVGTGAAVGGSGAAGVAGGAAGAASDATAKTLGIYARMLMKARQSARTQTLTAAGAIVAACAILAYALSGSPDVRPLADPPTPPSLVAVAPPRPAPVPTSSPAPPTTPPMWHPPAPRPKPKPSPTPVPSPPPTPPAPTAAPAVVEPTTQPEPEPSESESEDPEPTPSEPSKEPSEPDICRKAREAGQNPSYSNIGVILAAQWDPRCRAVGWAPYR